MRASAVLRGMAIITMITACAESPRSPQDTTRDILAGAERALGAATTVETIDARADVTGPDVKFVTRVWSARDGRARMEQSLGFTAVHHPSGGWQRTDPDGDRAPLAPEVHTVVTGHELHITAIAPTSRYTGARAVEPRQFAGEEALTVEFAGGLGDPVFIHYSREDTLPLGMTLTRPDPDVVVTFDDWFTSGGVRLFRQADFVQGEETYHYDFTVVTINTVVDSMFLSDGSHTD